MYRYMEDLLVLDSHTHSEDPGLPPHLSRVVTPVRVEDWRRELVSYPDTRLGNYLLQGFTYGFQIGLTTGHS